MSAPSFDPALIDELARVLAHAALEEILREAEAQESAAAPTIEPKVTGA
jgi:hypothetical protein